MKENQSDIFVISNRFKQIKGLVPQSIFVCSWCFMTEIDPLVTPNIILYPIERWIIWGSSWSIKQKYACKAGTGGTWRTVRDEPYVLASQFFISKDEIFRFFEFQQIRMR